MDLDRREEVLLEMRDQQVLDHYLDIPKERMEKLSRIWMEKEHISWTGDFPIGPSTTWWKEGLTDEDGASLKWSPRKKQKVLD